MKIDYFIFIFSTIFLSCCAKNEEIRSICELADNPSKYDGRVIEIEAMFLPSMIHGSLLVDSRCENYYLEYMESQSAGARKFSSEVFGDIFRPMAPFSIKAKGKFVMKIDGKRLGYFEISDSYVIEQKPHG